MGNADIRWKQRFQNFEKALSHLDDAVKKDDLSVLEKAGVIQLYEISFELAWKTLKDYLEDRGVEVKFPRETIKEGYSFGIIKEGDVWMDMLQKRNLMSHAYDEQKADLAFSLIVNSFLKELKMLYNLLKLEL